MKRIQWNSEVLPTLNSIYDARFASHCASSISNATQKMLSNAMSSSLSNSRKWIPARVLGVPEIQMRSENATSIQNLYLLIKREHARTCEIRRGKIKMGRLL